MSQAQKIDIDQMTPRQIVEELDRYIVGQKEAKKAVALAIRNRIRRRLVDGPIKEEIYPKNIIMIGPTGCGKTEIARRLSRLSGAPFVKVEATKYTEVGYVGRDVESMIRDLVATSVNLVKKEYRIVHEEQARKNSIERLLDLLLPSTSREKPQPSVLPPGLLGMSVTGQNVQESLEQNGEDEERKNRVRELLRGRLTAGELEDREVELEVSAPGNPMVQVLSGPNMEDIDMQVQNMLGDLMPRRQKRRKVTVAEAREILLGEELEKLIDADRVQSEAVRRAEQMGIVFIDELDKIAGKSQHSGPDVSREGVQRDLLPIVEGATVNTRYGPIKTDHILFIAAGAFHMSRPSDLIPELQGRFPIRVELEKLTEADFRLILDGPENSLTRQAEALLATEKVELTFAPEALQEMARLAYKVNEDTENIGARRLNTIMERLLEDLSFEAPDLPVEQRKILITGEFVRDRLAGIMENRDLSQYIL